MPSVTLEKVLCMPKKLPGFSNLWEWRVRVWGNGGKSTDLHQGHLLIGAHKAEALHLMLRFRELSLAHSGAGWLAELWSKRWPTLRDLETPTFQNLM